MLEEGGILVSPSMDGKRKGYRFGFDRGKETAPDTGADKGQDQVEIEKVQAREQFQRHATGSNYSNKRRY